MIVSWSGVTIDLGKFRNGMATILIVTDVSARGIDIPLLDNVINYDFPPTVKLFVHRVGRAGRMGRPGSAYSLISSDEMPYMIDIHLYLCKPVLDTVPEGSKFSESDVYYGRLPQESLDFENDVLKEMMRNNIDLQDHYKSTLNAYKLYHKTRAKPSGESVRRAKEFSNPTIHPLILQETNEKEKERDNLVQSLKKFRPSQTVFEMGTTPSKSIPALIMSAKRRIHSDVIEKVHQKEPSYNQISDNIPSSSSSITTTTTPTPPTKRQKKENFNQKVVEKIPKTFKDEQFYMNNLPDNYLTEKALSVSSSNQGLYGSNISFEVGADDNASMKKNQKIQKWDRKRKRFVFASVSVDVNNRKNGKKWKWKNCKSWK